MGFFSQLALDVEELLSEGASIQDIAKRLRITDEHVKDCIAQLDECDQDPDDYTYHEYD